MSIGISPCDRDHPHTAFVLTVAKVKRDRKQGIVLKASICKGFREHKPLVFPETNRKRWSMPTGEVRLSDTTFL